MTLWLCGFDEVSSLDDWPRSAFGPFGFHCRAVCLVSADAVA